MDLSIHRCFNIRMRAQNDISDILSRFIIKDVRSNRIQNWH